MTTHIGQRIKELLDAKSLKPMDLANKLSITRQAVYDMLNKRHLNTEMLERVSEALAVPVGWFFSEEKAGHNQIATGNGNRLLVNSQLYEQEHAELLLCRKEVEGLKRENELLREMNDLLKKK